MYSIRTDTENSNKLQCCRKLEAIICSLHALFRVILFFIRFWWHERQFNQKNRQLIVYLDKLKGCNYTWHSVFAVCTANGNIYGM